MASLPYELIIIVAEFLKKESDMNALAKTNGRFYYILNKPLYRHNNKYSQSRALEWAIKNDRSSTARKAIEAGFTTRRSRNVDGDVWYFPSYLEERLAQAIEYQRKEIIELLLAQDIDFTMPHTSTGTNPIVLGAYVLSEAASIGDSELFHVLLDRVSNTLLEPDTPPQERRWEYHVAKLIELIMDTQQLPLLKALLNRGISLCDPQYVSPGSIYCAAKDKAIFDYLLSCGVKCRLSQSEALDMLLTAMTAGNTSAIDYAFEKYGSRSRGPLTLSDMEDALDSHDLFWPEWYSIDKHNMEITVQHLLINRYADPNPLTNRWASNVFHDAFLHGHGEVMQTIIKACYAHGMTTTELLEGIRASLNPN